MGTLNNGCRIIIMSQKGTLILTTTHMNPAILGVIGPGFLNQAPTLRVLSFGFRGLGFLPRDPIRARLRDPIGHL